MNLGDFRRGLFALIVGFGVSGVTSSSGNGTTMRRTRAITLGGTLLVVFGPPEPMFPAEATSFSAFFDHGAAGTVRPSESLATITAPVTFTRRRKEDVRFSPTHRGCMP